MLKLEDDTSEQEPGLGADLLRQHMTMSPTDGLGAMLAGTPMPSPFHLDPAISPGNLFTVPGAGAGSDHVPATQTAPPAPRLTPGNLDRLNRILTAEARGCRPEEIRAVASTILNRMDRARTDDVAAVTGHGQYAIAKEADPSLAGYAWAALSNNLQDSTGGATHFYSPRSMPREGQPTKNTDTGGGLEQSPNLRTKNWSPGFANGPKKYPRRDVDGVREEYFKFYAEPGTGRVH